MCSPNSLRFCPTSQLPNVTLSVCVIRSHSLRTMYTRCRATTTEDLLVIAAVPSRAKPGTMRPQNVTHRIWMSTYACGRRLRGTVAAHHPPHQAVLSSRCVSTLSTQSRSTRCRVPRPTTERKVVLVHEVDALGANHTSLANTQLLDQRSVPRTEPDDGLCSDAVASATPHQAAEMLKWSAGAELRDTSASSLRPSAPIFKKEENKHSA